MEPMVVGSVSRRGRKRKINNVDNVMDCNGRTKVVETRSHKLVGGYVQKEFQDSGFLLGRIMLYNSGLYRINYENGDCEYLNNGQVKAFLVNDGDLTSEWSERKEKLDEFLLSKDVNARVLKVENMIKQENANLIDSVSLSELIIGDAGQDEVAAVPDDCNNGVNADSSSDSCEGTREGDVNLDMEVPLVPPPELPPSSGHIGIPEEYVSHLLSVYSFLRSFSVPLFLYPFGLDDFVGALNCSVTNTLLDSVHVALMCVLKRHFERLSSDGSDLASKCLRCLDWNLLDTLTWPIYLVHYLMVMGYKNGHEWKRFYSHSLERDYYTLSTGKKLAVLQILCEDVLDSEELRTVMDMREESEVGIDLDTSTIVATTCEPRRVHPRYFKTSACKDIDTKHSVAKHHEITSSRSGHSMESQVIVENFIDEDGNGDECHLCGMDGFLVCCDGCPSSYHSRCLGLNKASMPDGSWYCPECQINASEPKILRGTALRGGHVFGVDPYEQVFIASCDHLLVLKASMNSENCVRYYTKQDIPGVIRVLYSKAEHVIAYSEICRGILQYWEVPLDIVPCSEMSEVCLQLANKDKSGECTTQVVNLLDKVPEMTEVENPESCASGICSGMAASCLMNSAQQTILSENSLDAGVKSERHIDSTRQQSGIIMKTTMTEMASCSSLIGHPADPCKLSQQSTSNVIKTVSCVTTNSRVKYNDPLNGTCPEAKASLSCQELNNRVDRRASQNLGVYCLYTGSSFKATGYINYYLHGDFSVSAAANLTILLSEENQVRESHSSDNDWKVVCASVALQVKAFSSAAMRFFWPNTEKKLVEVPRERCSWCFSCKAPATSKRGCLLNAAASNAIRSAMKEFSGVRPAKNGDGRLYGIATYIMFVEKSLSGLLIGPFINDTFRKQWRKKVEQATTCIAIKILLLELEENIRTIALSGDWTKLVEGCSTQSPSSQIAASAAGSTQKRRPGRRGRRLSAMLEVEVDCRKDMLTNFTWWRGGTLSKLMLGRGILPCSLIKKSAREGGVKRIPGIHYIEGNEIPKLSRQLFWRSTIEMSRNTAQLALQVRYLDFHLRWSDLVRPQQTASDGKSPETEASAFRNALIYDKKIVEREVRYCVAFGSQKHLPSRLMKNIAEIEQMLNGRKERYWFSETYIPLYLIKEFEQKVQKNKPVDVLPKLYRRQFKVSRKKTLSSLFCKQDMVRSYCCSCHQDIFYRNAVKCSVCQEFCHELCATISAINMGEEFEITCKRCCENQGATQVKSSNEPPRSPLLLQARHSPNPATTTKHIKLVGYKGPPASVGSLEHSSEVKPTNHSAVAKARSKILHWGLIWRKKNFENTGIDFRLKNILLRGNPDRDLLKPLCRLCNQKYNADLMYIRCETCQYWFHADALDLDESKIFSLVGFKCCKCRRIKSPVCPYLDPEKKKVLEDKIERQQAVKQEISAINSDSSIISEHHREVESAYSALPRKAEVVRVAGDAEVKQYTEYKSEVNNEWNNANVFDPEPRKLPVRRYINQEKDVSCQAGSFKFEISAPYEANVFTSTEKLPARRCMKRQTHLGSHLATNSLQVEVSDPSKANAVSSTQDSLSSQAQYIAYEGGGDSNDSESPENVIENWKTSSVLPESEAHKITFDQEEPIISVETTTQIMPCKICSNTDPCPDLFCQICCMWIHRRCSPWFESSSCEDGWKCGNCRQWR